MLVCIIDTSDRIYKDSKNGSDNDCLRLDRAYWLICNTVRVSHYIKWKISLKPF